MDKVGIKIAVIGGGTGSFTLLTQLKHYTRYLTALVNMADDGGSTGQLRDEFGVLPPGDVRQCLVALSESPRVRDLFNYRFDSGSMEGHAFGNLFLTALEKMTGSFAEAVETASEVLNITGSVHPVTLDKVTLVLHLKEGKTIEGEFAIAHVNFAGDTHPELELRPHATLNPAARAAILDADMVVIAPGNIYGSLAPALIVSGMSEALQQAKGKKVYVCNLVTKPGQTDNFQVHDFAGEIERFGGFKLDYVLYNNAKPSEYLLKRYAKENEYWVGYDEALLARQSYETIGGHFVSNTRQKQPPKGDSIAATRTLIRHDADAVARQLMRIYLG